MIRVVTAGALAPDRVISLDEFESHHLRVRRAVAGDQILIHDGRGAIGHARLRSLGSSATLEVESVERLPPPPAVTLAVGAGDRDRFQLLVEKAVELGATTIVPLETERTAAVAARLRGPQLEKLRRRALEALKQCGAAWVLEVREPIALAEWLPLVPPGMRWQADPTGDAAGLLGADEAVTVVIGPEGGFTGVEQAELRSAAFRAVALGSNILRFETAAFAALALVWQARQRRADG